MASERRDVELLIRARNLAARPFKELEEAVGRITNGIQGQVAAAQRGEASLDELKTTVQQLERVLRALAEQEGALNLFVRISGQLDAAKQKAAEARAAFDQFSRSLSGTATPTKEQQRELTRLGRSADEADRGVARLTTSFERQSAKLRQIGIPIDQITQSQDSLVTAGQRAASSLNVVERAVESFGQEARQRRDDARRLRDALAEALPAQRINAIVANRKDDEAAQKQLAAFRELADQAERTARSYRSLDGVTREITTSGQSAAAAVRQITDAAGVERSTLSGLEKQVRQLATAVQGINGPVQEYEATLLRLGQAQRAAGRQAELIDAFQRQVAQVRAARAAFVEAERTVKTYAAQVRQSTEPNKELADRLKQAQAALAAADREFKRQVADARELRAELRAAGIDTSKLSDEQLRLVRVARQATDSAQRLTNAFERFGRSNRGQGGLFGLSPYAIQNLGFQINDVFTQLASGASVTQTLAQQGGQFLQVWNIGLDRIARRAPQILSAIAAIGVSFAALNREIAQISAQRGFEGLIRASADGARYQAAALTEATRAIQRYGASFGDAEKAVRTFVQNGINPARIVEFGRVAQNLADVFRVELPDAAKTLAESFNSGYEGIRRLNDQFPLLDAARLTEIRRLYEQGRAQEAATLALNTFVQRSDDAAGQARGPWTSAYRDLRRAWDDLLASIGNTVPFQLALRAATALARGIQELLNLLPGGGAVTIRTLSPESAAASFAAQQAERQLRQAQQELVELEQRRARTNVRFVAADLDRQISETRLRVEQLSEQWRQANAGARNAAEPVQQTAEATGEVVAQTQRARAEAERLTEEQRRQLVLGLRIKDVTQDQLRTLGLQSQRELELERIRIAGAQARERILQADASATDLANQAAARAEAQERQRIAEELRGAASAGASARDQVRRDLQAIEQDFRSIVQARDSLLGDIQDRLRAGSINAVEAFEQARQVAERFQPRLRALADEMVRFRDANRGADGIRDLRLDANVERFNREAGGRTVNREAERALQAGEQEVNRILQERAALIQSITNLAQARGLTESEVSERIRQAYASTNGELGNAIDALQRLIDRLRETGDVSSTVLDRMQAKVDEFRTRVEFVDPAWARMRQSIESAFSGAALQGLQDIATALAEVINGTKTWGDVAVAAGNAVLNTIARVLQAIAEEIIRTQALIAVKLILNAVSGGSGSVLHSGGVIGSAAGGIRRRRVDPAWFAGAPRYHGGGVVGLRPDEQAAILQRGEEVLARDDPRNIMNLARNAGQGGPGEVSIRSVLVQSEAEAAAALATAQGERVVIAHIKRNAPTIRQMLGLR